jgi:hypothetical protein
MDANNQKKKSDDGSGGGAGRDIEKSKFATLPHLCHQET